MSLMILLVLICSTKVSNFGRKTKPSLFIGGLRDNAVFEVTNWKPSDFRILPQYAYC